MLSFSFSLITLKINLTYFNIITHNVLYKKITSINQFSISVLLIIFLAVSSSILAQSNKEEVKKTFFPNGKLESVGTYFNGKKNGYYREYYSSGQLWKEWFFVDGKEENLSYWYFEDGTKSMEWNYVHGLLQGVSKWYYGTGELWSDIN